MERGRAEGRSGRTDPGASSAMAAAGAGAACALPVAVVICGGQIPPPVAAPAAGATPTAALAYW